MSVALTGMTAAAFLEWEDRQPLRYEFDGIAPQAMTAGTRNLAAVQSRLILAVGTRLRGAPCEVFGSELKVSTDGSFRYPDAMIVCTRGSGNATVVDDPVVVFEIVSPPTERVDRVVKNAEYSRTPSIQAYVLLQPDFVGATMFHRASGDWIGHAFGPGSVITLPGAGIDLPLDELYEGLDLPG